ncbi:Pertussis toxin, subunit 1, partial [Pseudomonas sp. ok272]
GVNAYRYALNPTGWVDPLGLNTCPGGDGCRPKGGPQDPAGKAHVEGTEPKAPKGEGDYLYRGDKREPNDVFENGFKSKGNSDDLLLHSIDSDFPSSNFISTSVSRDMGKKFATSDFTKIGYLYTLNKIPGHDLKKELGTAYLFGKEKEIAIRSRINPEDVLGATLIIDDGREFGFSMPNPNRKIKK